MFGIEIPKQRGIYSEILTTEDTDNLKVSLQALIEPVHIEANLLFLYFSKYRHLDLAEKTSAR